MYMKTRALIIIGLLVLCFITPAFADTTYNLDKMFSDNRAVNVLFENVVVSNSSQSISPFNYPPDQYEYVTVYYSLYNPSASDIGYEFNISIKDQANHYYAQAVDEFIGPDNVPAGGHVDRRNDFAIYKNTTNFWIVWTDKQINPPWNHYDTVINVTTLATPTPYPVTPTPTVSATPTTAPTTAPNGNCLPFLPLGLLLTVVGGIGLLSMKYRNGR